MGKEFQNFNGIIIYSELISYKMIFNVLLYILMLLNDN